MSYCRFSADSDVYLFFHVNGFIDCCGCWLSDEDRSHQLHNGHEVYDHLLQHKAAGHQIHPELLTYTAEDWQDEWRFEAVLDAEGL